MTHIFHFKIYQEPDGQWWVWNYSPQTKAGYLTASGNIADRATMFKTYEEVSNAVYSATLKRCLLLA